MNVDMRTSLESMLSFHAVSPEDNKQVAFRTNWLHTFAARCQAQCWGWELVGLEDKGAGFELLGDRIIVEIAEAEWGQRNVSGTQE
jgi:hypothetical protein